MAYSSWSHQNMNNNRFQRQQCYLCDCPRAPWAILNDFSEAVCRGCCNYEGPDRIEAVIDYVRSLRKEHQLRTMKHSNLNSTGTSLGSSPSPGGHSNGSIDAARNPQYPFPGPYHNLIPHNGDHLRFLHAIKSESQQHNQDGTPDSYPPKTPFGPSENPPPSSVANQRTEDNPHDERRFIQHPSGKDLPPPSHMPLIRRPLEYAEFPEVVRETLEVLNTCVPFDVRFKKDHNHIGRVFLFEAAPRTGATSSNEYELKIHIEYPRGSENFCQSASSVAKQMYQDSMKELGRGLSSGFKYLEYEIQGNPNEWRLLGDLLPENVRYFKEPVARTFLPMRVTDHPSYHPVLGPPQFGQAKYRQKRKAEDVETHSSAPSRAPRRTYKERQDEQIQHHIWMQSQVDALQLSNHMNGPSSASHLNTIRSSLIDHPRHPAPIPHPPLTPSSATPTTPHQASPKAPWGVPTSMAALISAASSADATQGTLRENRKLSTSENIKSKSPPAGEKEKSEVKEEAKTEENPERKEPEGHTKKTGGKGTSQLKCIICDDWLEDTHFVQCPSVSSHKFCFPCSKESIKKQGLGSDVFCPSGKRCPLSGSNLPWAFMVTEIDTILETKGRPKQGKDENKQEEGK